VTADLPAPYELWVRAGEDGERYRQLLREHGLLVPGKRQPLPCGWPDRRVADPTPATEVWSVVCATGHRRIPPAVLPWVRTKLAAAATWLRDQRQTRVGISGMALGADMLWAEAVLDAGLGLHAHVPFPQQPNLWPDDQRVRWRRLLERAAEVVWYGDLDGVPEAQRKATAVRLLHARNDGMLAASAAVVAVYDPRQTGGGTASAVRKAIRLRLPVVHLDPAARTVRVRTGVTTR
jgi:uncharacterized phage-like protein YoqJ